MAIVHYPQWRLAMPMRTRIYAAQTACKRPPMSVSRPRRAPSPGNQAVLRRLATDGSAHRRTAPPVVHDVLRSSGRPLDSGTRGFFERGLGANLAAVRVHDDAMAAHSARAVGALAYTVGPHVVFGAGRHAPSRPEGLNLLAHELTHVVQSGGRATPLPGHIEIGAPNAREERHASFAAARLAAAQPAGVMPGSAAPALRRQTPDDQPKKDPKPLIPLPVVDKLDVAPFVPVPTPGGSGPTPYDAPGKSPDPSGKGPSLEDLHGAGVSLFGKQPLQLGLNKNFQMPDCSRLETPDSTKAAPKYKTFEQYDLDRKLYHSPLSKDPWPPLTREQYKAAIDACPKAAEAPKQEVPVIPKDPLPKGDFPTPTQPPGQAVV
jgi:hypothetical protein